MTGVDSTLLSYQSPSTLNGKSNQTITVDQTKDANDKSIIKWKLLGKDENDQILLIAANPIAYGNTRYSFSIKGKIGFLNGVEELNKICGLYGHGTYADTSKYIYSYNETSISTGGRSVRVEDINKVLSYTPAQPVSHIYSKNEDDGYIYYDGTKGTDDVTTFIYYDETTGNWVPIDSGESASLLHTYYSYTIGTSTNKQKMLRYYDSTTTNSTYWLASQTVSCNNNGVVNFSLRRIASGGMYGGSLFDSNDVENDYGRGVRPVVTLAPNVILVDQDANGAWNLGIEE